MLVIGLNQAIDRTVRLPALTPGDVLRATNAVATAGGKAVNVCRAAATLGAPARLVGPCPGELGRYAAALLASEGIDAVPVPVAGEIRTCTIVLEESGRATVINEPGPLLDAADWKRVVEAITTELPPRAVVAISGSAQPGTPADAHRTLVELVHGVDGFVAVDVTGEALLTAARAGADLVSPNLAEVEAAIAGDSGPSGGESVDLDGEDHIRDAVADRADAAAAALVETGAGVALVSAGRHGVAYRTATDAGFVDAPSVDVVNPIGAGDALLGATLVAVEQGRQLPDAVAAGVAYAAASVAHPTAGYADPELVAHLGAARR